MDPIANLEAFCVLKRHSQTDFHQFWGVFTKNAPTEPFATFVTSFVEATKGMTTFAMHLVEATEGTTTFAMPLAGPTEGTTTFATPLVEATEGATTFAMPLVEPTEGITTFATPPVETTEKATTFARSSVEPTGSSAHLDRCARSQGYTGLECRSIRYANGGVAGMGFPGRSEKGLGNADFWRNIFP